MDLIELALNPRKAAQRFSPFTNELPQGMGRKLEYYFGDLASTDPGERILYSRDASTPPAAMKLLLKRDAWAVVRPRIRGDLIELIKFANDNGIPIVPRGSGTSGYGGAVPTEGGVVVDMRDFNRVIAVDAKSLKVRVEGNITFADLETELRKHGLALRQYPTSYYGATVAGWVAQGGGGVGSAKYGPFKNDVLEVTLVQPDGATAVLDGEDLDLVNETHGTAGFMVEVVLKVRKDNPIVPYLASFPDIEAATRAARRLGREASPYSLHVHTPDYADLVNEAAKRNILPKGKWSIMVAVEDVGNLQQIEVLKGVVKSGGGDFASDADAKKAWDARFDHLNVKRLGPSVVVSEVIHPIDELKEAYLAASAAAKMERQVFWAIAVSPKEFDLIYYGLEEERRPTYAAALGNSLAVIDAVKQKAHGRAYSTGVLQANESAAYFRNGAPQGPPVRQLLGGLVGGLVGGVVGAVIMLAAALLGAASANNVLNVLSFGTGIQVVGAVAFALVLGVLGAIGGVALRPGDRVFSFLLAQMYAGAVFTILWLLPMLLGSSTIPLTWGSLLVGLLVVGPFAMALGLIGGHIAYPMEGVLGKLRQHRDETDPRDVFNPGPVVGGRTRIMPLPARDLALQLALAAPLIKSQRGMFGYRGGDKADPSTLAVSTAIGRVHGGALAEVDYDVTTCIFCASCNHVAPERIGATMESQLPRGRVQLAKALLEGRISPTREMQRKAAMNPLSHTPDAICPVLIPIARATDLLLGACVDDLGPIPEHAALADHAEKEWNVLGRPKDQRGKWAALAWTTDSRTLYFADDVASYDTPEIAVAAANVVMNAGTQLTYLTRLERTSGATLIETGQRAAAKALVAPMLEEMKKRGIDSIITPDANAVRVMKMDWPIFGREEDVPVPSALHTTVAIASYLKTKRLEIGETWNEKVVYHAPEGLTPEDRQAGLDILKALGADVVLHEHHECGQGRALDKLNPALQGAISERCLKAAAATGAKVIVTANPGCHAILKPLAKKAKAGVEVVDLHDVVMRHMKTREGGVAAPVALPAAEDEKPKEPVIGPDQYRVEFAKEGVVLAVGKNQTILEAGEAAGLELPSSCRAGSCDTCSAKWEGTASDQSAGAALSADQQKTYVLTCIAKPKGPIKIWSDERP